MYQKPSKPLRVAKPKEDKPMSEWKGDDTYNYILKVVKSIYYD